MKNSDLPFLMNDEQPDFKNNKITPRKDINGKSVPDKEPCIGISTGARFHRPQSTLHLSEYPVNYLNNLYDKIFSGSYSSNLQKLSFKPKKLSVYRKTSKRTTWTVNEIVEFPVLVFKSLLSGR